MAQKFLTNVELEAGLVDGSNSTGTSGYLLSSTGTATSWVDPAAVSVGESEQVHIACKNTSGVAISKGDPVYITGTVGNSFVIQIAAADASNSAKMPAVGLAETNLGINAEGFVIVSGVLKNLTTQPLSTGDGTPSSNDTVYVKAGGGLTKTKPTGSANLIQNVGKVGRVNSANAGSLAVSTIMRTNDVPNLTTGKIWVGDGNTVESTVVHLDESNNRMGINTNSPQVPLEAKYTGTVDEIVRIVGTASGKPQMTFYNDTTLHTKIVAAGNNDFSISNTHSTGNMFFATGGATALHIQPNGNVGIGTTGAGSKLEVNGEIDANGGDGYRIETKPFANWGSDLLTLGDWDGEGYETRFMGSSSSEVMRVTDTKVGIGTTSPGAKLDVNGVIRGEQYLRLTDTGGTNQFSIRAESTYGTLDNGSKTFNYIASNHLFLVGVSEKMRINSSGNVGIGTTSPSYKLDVDGEGRFGDNGGILLTDDTGTSYVRALNNHLNLRTTRDADDIYFSTGTTPTTKMFIEGDTGDVGIGTTGPAQKLHVIGNSEITGDIFLGRYIFHNDDNNTWLGFPLADTISFRTNGSDRMYINSSGNVGIGTTSPGAKLDIFNTGGSAGSLADCQTYSALTIKPYSSVDSKLTFSANGISTQLIQATNNAGTTGRQISLQPFSGNVGIGVILPSEKLQVNGSVKASASTDAYKGYIKQNVISYGAEKVENSNYYFTAYNTTSTVTTAQAYNRIVAAYDGRVKKVYIRHAGASTPTATAVNFKKHTNGTTSSTVYSATVANTASANMTAYYEFAQTDFTFNAGDLIGLLYQTTDAFGTASKTMGGVAVTITLEYNIT